MSIVGTSWESLHAVKNIKILDGEAKLASKSPLIQQSIVLEEYGFKAIVEPMVTQFASMLANLIFVDNKFKYWNNLLQQNLVLLSDDDYRDFTQLSTEVITRTKIDNETGTVEDGALFTEEYLPTESILYSLVFSSDEYGKQKDKISASAVMQYFQSEMNRIELFQLGGNATLGKGILRTKIN